jgi:hypothetical protein
VVWCGVVGLVWRVRACEARPLAIPLPPFFLRMCVCVCIVPPLPFFSLFLSSSSSSCCSCSSSPSPTEGGGFDVAPHVFLSIGGVEGGGGIVWRGSSGGMSVIHFFLLCFSFRVVPPFFLHVHVCVCVCVLILCERE